MAPALDMVPTANNLRLRRIRPFIRNIHAKAWIIVHGKLAGVRISSPAACAIEKADAAKTRIQVTVEPNRAAGPVERLVRCLIVNIFPRLFGGK